MRLFDDTLASKVATAFKLGAISTSQKEFAVSVVQHKCQGMADPNPTYARPLQPGDTVVLVAPLEKIRHVEAANH